MAGPESLFPAPTGRHGLPADAVASYQRERLMVAMIELVAKRGYRGTSVDHLVKAARVGYVAFYELFEDKEGCFLAAFERIAEESRAAIEAAGSTAESWPEQIAAGLGALVELMAADRARARVGLVEVQAAGQAALACYEAAMESAVPKLREGRALSAEAAALSEALEESILGGIAWIFHQRLVKGEADQLRELLGEVVEIALSPYLGEDEARRIAAAAQEESTPA
jgi:AcrR family transcriptional regulator